MILQTWVNAVDTEYLKTIVFEDKDNGTMTVKYVYITYNKQYCIFY